MRNWRPLMVTVTCGIHILRNSMLVRREHGTNGGDGGIEALGDLAVGGFERARTGRGGVELGGEPRAIAPERVHLRVELFTLLIGLAPPFHRRRQRIERKRKTFAGRVDGVGLGHIGWLPPCGPIAAYFVSLKATRI